MEAKWICDNDDCGAEFDSEQDFRPLIEIPGLWGLLEPGSIVPTGECRNCGEFVYGKPSRVTPIEAGEINV